MMWSMALHAYRCRIALNNDRNDHGAIAYIYIYIYISDLRIRTLIRVDSDINVWAAAWSRHLRNVWK